uniref:HTH_11 domain-containing protein n=1 Tax=Heterorhabditis bacteriophora TaxID=37862 RepID=A0A1I7W6C8_HETBA
MTYITNYVINLSDSKVGDVVCFLVSIDFQNELNLKSTRLRRGTTDVNDLIVSYMHFSMFNTNILYLSVCFQISKGKNITPNQQVMIKVLLDQNLSQVQIAKKLKLSRCAIQNAIKHINKFGMLENAPRTPRKRTTTERID